MRNHENHKDTNTGGARALTIKYHQLLLKVCSIDGKSRFDQLATANYGPTVAIDIWTKRLLYVQILTRF